MNDEGRLYLEVCEILLREWDPIGVNEYPEAHDEYDMYAPGLLWMMETGADELALQMHLAAICRVRMGLTFVDENRNQIVARHLLSLLTAPLEDHKMPQSPEKTHD